MNDFDSGSDTGRESGFGARQLGSELVRSQQTRKEQDPWSILDVPSEATDDEIRAAYTRKVKEYPPDRCGPEFERIRDAYDQLKDPYRRAKYLILGAATDRPLESLLDDVPAARRHVGPEPWLTVIKSQRKEQQR